MRTFRCQCGARVFFENTHCLACNRELGFFPDRGHLATLVPSPNGEYCENGARYRKCANYVDQGVCNWMLPSQPGHELCQACRLNNVIPNLGDPENRKLWAQVESAKRRLVYSLNQLRLPLPPKNEDGERGLAFDIKAETSNQRVTTGHSDGLITLNLAEADAVAREQTRVSLNERYRTLLGHFRHEIAHYYWERLIRDTPLLPAFRELFGDERNDYAEALKKHYQAGAGAWTDDYISAYAAAHPWEDFAETFAHYLHMIDTLETARDFGFVGRPAADAADFDARLGCWVELTVALNALNRSMGLPDVYPFTLNQRVRQKLEFVHNVLQKSAAA
jgi:hypothetical protein